jgi:hypothetical protein
MRMVADAGEVVVDTAADATAIAQSNVLLNHIPRKPRPEARYVPARHIGKV